MIQFLHRLFKHFCGEVGKSGLNATQSAQPIRPLCLYVFFLDEKLSFDE